MSTERINLMGVPLDILHEEDIDSVVTSLLQKEGVQQVVFLDLWSFLKARRHNDFRTLVLNASLVLPVSKSLISAAKFLKLAVPVRRRPFDVIINFLTVLESHFMSVYLLGGRKETLAIAERNVRSTFPSLKVVGRFTGYYPKTLERDIVTAIAKAEPKLTLVSSGIKGGAQWINKNREHFYSGIFVYDKDIFDIFAKTKRAVSEKTFNKGYEYLEKVFKNPFRLLNVFRFLRFKLLVLFYRLLKKNN